MGFNFKLTYYELFLECRGSKGRSVWYFFHWLLGTTICLAGIINTYTGLNAYHERTSKPISLWTIIFTAQISFMGFFYLFQDKWEYIQKQGVILENNETMTPQVEIVVPQIDEQKMIMRTESGRKSNALGTFFSRSNVLNKLLQQTWNVSCFFLETILYVIEFWCIFIWGTNYVNAS